MGTLFYIKHTLKAFWGKQSNELQEKRKSLQKSDREYMDAVKRREAYGKC